MEKTLVLIKPDAMVKELAGHIITDLYKTGLRMIGLKLVNIQRELAEQHYSEHREKPFFEELIKHITGELHNQENVIAIVYEGEDAVKKVRELAGKTHPEEASTKTIRGKYGRMHSKTNCFENVIHASDSPESAEREIKLWFEDKEIID
ncbi:nucleoside-diphosphate kinase [Candidatus Pacearchaeota archaeon ex4484_71]|nr:MAG: nucleoside-diphosphate kinase [Candidatus Pacearchaeota archaeon ex4484_71]